MLISPNTVSELLARLDAAGSGSIPPPPTPPLRPSGDGGIPSSMEARVAKLEALIEQVRADVSKLGTLPVDIASIKERQNHLPTKAEVKTDLDAAIDRLGTRVQRNIAIVGTLATVIGVAVTIITKLV